MTKVVVPNLPATNVVVGRTESEDSGRQEMQQCWERKQPVDSHRPAAWTCRGYSMTKVVVPKWDAFEKRKEREKRKEWEKRKEREKKQDFEGRNVHLNYKKTNTKTKRRRKKTKNKQKAK